MTVTLETKTAVTTTANSNLTLIALLTHQVNANYPSHPSYLSTTMHTDTKEPADADFH